MDKESIKKALEERTQHNPINCSHSEYVEACGMYCRYHRKFVVDMGSKNGETCKDCNKFTATDEGKEYADILTLINELESENERLNKSDTSKEESSIEYYNLYKDLKRKNKDLNELCELQRVSISENFVKENQLKDRIAELEGEITKSDIINSKLEMDIELLNKQNIDLEIDRDYYQEQFNEQEDFYVEWDKQQLKQFAERLKEKCNFICSNSITATDIDETLKEFIEL